MSANIKVDVQWSPIDDDIFITYGAAINLFKAKEKDSTFEVFHQEKQSLEPSKIIHLATNSDLQFIKCVAWYPQREAKNIFAVAQTNGRISFVGFDYHGTEDFIGKEFNVRYSRQCNYLAWNPVDTHLLAQGLERVRNEPCVLIWDINSSNMSDMGERPRYSFSEGPVTKPAYEIGSGESSPSFSWYDSKTFLVGMANKHIKFYDLRDTNKPHMNVQHRCVGGICIEPTEKQRLASFHENHVAIWDLRSFDRPISTITENKHVIKLSWCPVKNGLLSVLTKESTHVKLHDIRHSVFGSDELEQISVERNVKPFGKSNLSSYCWHPRHENRLLAVMANGNLRDMTVYERIPMEWSTNFELCMPSSKDVINYFEDKGTDSDISTVMRKRLVLNYGLDVNNIESNMKAVKGEAHLTGLWRWIQNIRMLIDTQTTHSSKYPTQPANGILTLLHMDKDDVLMNSEAVGAHWKASENVKYSKRTHYRSNERTIALHLCGWVPDHPKENFDGFIEGLVKEGNPERASAVALFYLHIKKALDILSNCAMNSNLGESKPSLQAVAMALSGFTEEENTLWKRTCGTLRYQLENPYLRAMFAFLACDVDNYEDVLNEEVMSVEDRIAFALIYLPDVKLKSYLYRLSEELTKTGDLDGILITGLSNSKGIELLGNFVDRTADVQTAAVAVVFSRSPCILSDNRIIEWIEIYRDLLDRWRFWFQRAQFDNVRQAVMQERVPPQVQVACNFCGKSVSPSLSVMNRISVKIQNVFSRGPAVRPKVTCCPSCRKALPRCAVCLAHMGTSSAIGLESGSKAKLVPFQEWFSWCMTCRHGGHAGHLKEWFSEHTECPVTGCVCKCAHLESVGRLKPQPLNR